MKKILTLTLISCALIFSPGITVDQFAFAADCGSCMQDHKNVCAGECKSKPAAEQGKCHKQCAKKKCQGTCESAVNDAKAPACKSCEAKNKTRCQSECPQSKKKPCVKACLAKSCTESCPALAAAGDKSTVIVTTTETNTTKVVKGGKGHKGGKKHPH